MKFKNADINFNKGFYRIFVLLAYVAALFVMGCCSFDYFWEYLLSGFLAGIFVYFIFFFLEWIVMGFANSENYDKNFVRIIIDKISKINFFPLIVYCFGFLLLFCLFATLEIRHLKIENDNLKQTITVQSNSWNELWGRHEVVDETR